MRRNLLQISIVALSSLAFASCGPSEPVLPERYAPVDVLFEAIDRNVAAANDLTKVADIDHSRLAAKAGEVMPPARVLIFSNAALESRMIEHNPMVGIDLPLRALAFEDFSTRQARLTYNRFEYLASRHSLGEEFRSAYEGTMSVALAGVSREEIMEFADNSMSTNGIVTLDSDHGFEETLDRVQKAIASQDDAVNFGIVDFALQIAERHVNASQRIAELVRDRRG